MVARILMVAMMQQQAPQIARVEISPAQAEIQVGQTVKLSAKVVDAAGNVVPNARVLWFGGGDGSVDSTGVVRGGFRGYIQVVAMATAPGSKRITEEMRVRVTPAPAAKLELSMSSLKLAVGSRLTLTGTAKSAENDIRYDPVRYSSSNPKVVAVTSDGRLQALRAGTVVITGAAGNARASASVEVVAAIPAALTITPGTTSVRTGDVVRFTVAVKDRLGKTIEGLTPRWSVAAVAAGGVGQVDPDGAFVAEERGTYTVSATVGTVSASSSDTVHLRRRCKCVVSEYSS